MCDVIPFLIETISLIMVVIELAHPVQDPPPPVILKQYPRRVQEE